MTDLEPFFTFVARIPPYDLRRLSPRQIDRHLTWWQQAHRSDRGGAGGSGAA